MTKNANGLWSVTLGPLESDLYEYQFLLDGRKITDPGNDMPKPQRQVDTYVRLEACALQFPKTNLQALISAISLERPGL